MIFAALQDTGAGTASASRVEGLRGLLDPALIVPRLLEIGVALVAGFLAYRVMRVLIRRLIERPFEEDDPVVRRMREQRARTVGSLIGSVVVVIIVAITTLTILSSFIDIGPLLASVGVLGLAISFGAQSLVKDVITGTFMMLEGQFGVGDVLRIGDVAGSVEAVSLRTVTLRDSRGVVHIIPNGEITRVSNLTKRWSRALLDIGVGYREDIDNVIAVLREIGAQLKADPKWGALLIAEPRVLGIESFDDSAVVIRMTVDTLPQQQWDIARELRLRIKRRFDADDIEIPFPHVTFYWGDDQRPDGPAQPPPPIDGRIPGTALHDRAGSEGASGNN
jgi:moderate conductance mechanosensitive channel